MEIKGELIFIGATETVSDKFKKRELVVRTESEYPQEISMQVTQAKCDILDGYQVGNNVVCHFNIRGKATEKDGKRRWFNNIDVWKMELLVATQVSGSQATQSGVPESAPAKKDFPF